MTDARAALTQLAAECHRAKWQFDADTETLMPAAEARQLVRLAFDALHRIGDMALKLRDASPLSSKE